MNLVLTLLTKHLWTSCLLLLVYVIYKWWVHPHKCFPNGVRGFPIVGAIPYLGKYPERVIAKWSRSTYGPVMSVRMGMKDVVLINDYDTLQKSFLKQRLVYGSRPSFPIIKSKYMQGGGLTFRATDAEEQIQRKFALKSLRGSNADAGSTEDNIKQVLTTLIQSIKKTNEKPADIKFLLAANIANIISSAAFGKTFDVESKQLNRMLVSLFGEYGKKSSEYIGILILYPGLKPFPPFKSAYEDFIENAAEVTRSDAFPSLEHRTRLPYTMAFIQEVFRFRTVVPFGIKRMAMKETTLEGFHIPKNTTIMPNIWAIHNDPKVWKNPETFDPERHLDEDCNFIPSKKVIPFGVGARSCAGEKLARMQIFLIFSSLFQTFTFLPENSTTLPELQSGINSLLFSPFTFKCVAKIRHTDVKVKT